MTERRWDLAVHDSHGRRRCGAVIWSDVVPAPGAAPPQEFVIVLLTAPAKVQPPPAAVAICVPAATNIRSVTDREALPRKVADLRLSPARMAAFESGRIVTATAGLVDAEEIFPAGADRPRLDRLALALLKAADAEAVAPYLALIRREFALRPGTDPLIALEARLSPADPKSRPPARAPGIVRLRKALQRLQDDEPPECTLEVMAQDLHFLSLFEDMDEVLKRDALARLLADVSGDRARRQPARRTKPADAAPGTIVPFPSERSHGGPRSET